MNEPPLFLPCSWAGKSEPSTRFSHLVGQPAAHRQFSRSAGPRRPRPHHPPPLLGLPGHVNARAKTSPGDASHGHASGSPPFFSSSGRPGHVRASLEEGRGGRRRPALTPHTVHEPELFSPLHSGVCFRAACAHRKRANFRTRWGEGGGGGVGVGVRGAGASERGPARAPGEAPSPRVAPSPLRATAANRYACPPGAREKRCTARPAPLLPGREDRGGQQ